MKVIDARSGQPLNPGDSITFPDGEWVYLERVDAGILTAKAVIHTGVTVNGQRVQGRRQTVPLAVRFLHPAFPFQHIGILPS